MQKNRGDRQIKIKKMMECGKIGAEKTKFRVDTKNKKDEFG